MVVRYHSSLFHQSFPHLLNVHLHVVVLQGHHPRLDLFCSWDWVLVLAWRTFGYIISEVFFDIEVTLLVISVRRCSLNFVRLPIAVMNSVRVLGNNIWYFWVEFHFAYWSSWYFYWIFLLSDLWRWAFEHFTFVDISIWPHWSSLTAISSLNLALYYCWFVLHFLALVFGLRKFVF